MYPSGFVLGKIYEILYTARGAPLTGRLAALRDVVSFLLLRAMRATHARISWMSSLVQWLATPAACCATCYALCVDEADRLVLDGVLTLIGGLSDRGQLALRPTIIHRFRLALPFRLRMRFNRSVSGKTDGLRNLQSRWAPSRR